MKLKNSTKIIPLITVCGLIVCVSACDKKVEQNATIVKINFIEQEKGVEPYPTRMIVTKNHLRIDDGGKNISDYILFDRKTSIIYSVNSDNQSVMAIKPKRLEVASPIKLKLSEKKIADLSNAPKINNIVATHYQLYTNEQLCFDVIAAKGLLDDVVQAFISFQQALADDGTYTMKSTPVDMQNACELSMDIFAPVRHLQYGFPVQVWDTNGYTRSLIDYDENYAADPVLFILPKNYDFFTVEEFRGGFRPGANNDFLTTFEQH